MILEGDCIDILEDLPPESYDSLVTDPPAGISFMGKDWDKDKGGRDQWIDWMTAVMKQAYRVLKPGAHGFVWAIPRTSHWTATALENAGFEIRDVVTHLFGSGFPKSHDVSKAIDKMHGAVRDVVGNNPNKRNAHKKGGRAFDKAVGGQKLESMDLTTPATPEAKQWQGWGTALKPASEHWILIRKPIAEKTVAKNVQKWGTGAINIDASRILSNSRPKPCTNQNIKNNSYKSDNSKRERDTFYEPSDQGRFPANLVLSHHPDCEPSPHVFPDGSTAPQCHDECPVKMMDKQSGGASRFFYCAKASKSERNMGCNDLPVKRNNRMQTGTGKISANMERFSSVASNHHPTVKPIKLMRYLIRMITPPGGKVLDPFAGSGSTGVAAKTEGFDFLGIEQDKEYVNIARARMEIV